MSSNFSCQSLGGTLPNGFCESCKCVHSILPKELDLEAFLGTNRLGFSRELVTAFLRVHAFPGRKVPDYAKQCVVPVQGGKPMFLRLNLVHLLVQVAFLTSEASVESLTMLSPY